jgi:hypothetical protein
MMDRLNANLVAINVILALPVLLYVIHALMLQLIIEMILLLFVLVVMDILIMEFWLVFNAIYLNV